MCVKEIGRAHHGCKLLPVTPANVTFLINFDHTVRGQTHHFLRSGNNFQDQCQSVSPHEKSAVDSTHLFQMNDTK